MWVCVPFSRSGTNTVEVSKDGALDSSYRASILRHFLTTCYGAVPLSWALGIPQPTPSRPVEPTNKTQTNESAQ